MAKTRNEREDDERQERLEEIGNRSRRGNWSCVRFGVRKSVRLVNDPALPKQPGSGNGRLSPGANQTLRIAEALQALHAA